MTQEFKNISINNIFNNTVNKIVKNFEVYAYKIWCLDHQINIEFNKLQFDSKHFITLCLFIELNKVKFKNKFYELCNDARIRIRDLINK